MQFQHIEGQLARWLEELSQFDMVIQHQSGSKHGNGDALSCIPQGEYCNCYEAGIHLSSLPNGGCKYCTHMQEKWSQFKNGVDDVIPIAIRSVQIASEVVDEEGHSAKQVEEGSASLLPWYTSEQL